MYRAQLWGMKRSNSKGGTRRTWLEKHHWKPPQANAAIEWDRSLHNHHIALLLFWDVFCATVQLGCSSVPCCIQPDTPHGGNYGNTYLPFKNVALKWILIYFVETQVRLCVVTGCVSGTCSSVLKCVFVLVYFLFQENSISLLLPSVCNHSTYVSFTFCHQYFWFRMTVMSPRREGQLAETDLRLTYKITQSIYNA